MAMTDWTIIRRSMSARLFSTVTTIVTVAIAVGLMLTLLAMRDSGRKAFDRGTGNMHLVISADSSPLVSVLNGVFYADAPSNSISWQKLLELLSLPSDYSIPTQLGDQYMGMPVLATTEEFFTHFSPNPDYRPNPDTAAWDLAQGRFFDAPFEVVVGARAAKETSIALGDTLSLTHGTGEFAHVHHDFTYTVVGILEPTGSSHDRAFMTDLTSSWLVHATDRRRETDRNAPLPTEADLTEADKLVTGIYYRAPTRGNSNVSSFLPTIASQLRADQTITVAQPKEEVDALFSIVSNIDQILIAMAGAVMVSSGIAIMLALYNSMEQRKRQIAILRVLGCNRIRIFGLVMTESAIIGIAGGIAGLAIAVIGTNIVASVLKERLGLVVDPAFDPQIVYVILVASLALAALAGLIPAAAAYQTPVAKNLKPSD
jgi:putative ABC transport system permease protein